MSPATRISVGGIRRRSRSSNFVSRSSNSNKCRRYSSAITSPVTRIGVVRPTNTTDTYSSCWIVIADEYRRHLVELLDRNRRRIPPTLIRVAGRLFADEYRRRLFELLDAYSPSNIPPTLIRVAGRLFADEYRRHLFECWILRRSCWIVIADEYRRRLFELLDAYPPTNTADAFSSCWTFNRRRMPPTLIRVAGRL